MTGDRKTEPPFGLDMDFGEALERFARTDPKEVAESIERSKQKKPPQDETLRRPKTSRSREDKSSSSGRQRKP
ncbi:hypothetical protein HDIA_3191 [Hartmannibacter diazotrophicus]|uniref:Uncharacterized protein n=1 Tax=Hartmannibacter diazotrophicus TaxID=1482074 RepID=A0A2C9D8T9_9HYPH|nr:hypothetical protein [Hartmannibacter diazotrophicus]SON56732.1 hypothetical protein HDIA_3191 [Hartmannibacter diazotrophicus]